MDTIALLHEPLIKYWKDSHDYYQRECRYNISTRFERADKNKRNQKTDGDRLLKKIYDLFHNGFGHRWSDAQIKIFNVIVDGMLALIYGNQWDDVKERVLKERGLTEYKKEVLINMGRRNGKTWIVATVCVIMFLLLKNIKIIIISVGKRQSGMFLECCVEKIQSAFALGTHVKQSDYRKVKNSVTELRFEVPGGSVNALLSLPGSIKVNPPSFPFPPKRVFLLFPLTPSVYGEVDSGECHSPHRLSRTHSLKF